MLLICYEMPARKYFSMRHSQLCNEVKQKVIFLRKIKQKIPTMSFNWINHNLMWHVRYSSHVVSLKISCLLFISAYNISGDRSRRVCCVLCFVSWAQTFDIVLVPEIQFFFFSNKRNSTRSMKIGFLVGVLRRCVCFVVELFDWWATREGEYKRNHLFRSHSS